MPRNDLPGIQRGWIKGCQDKAISSRCAVVSIEDNYVFYKILITVKQLKRVYKYMYMYKACLVWEIFQTRFSQVFINIFSLLE